jgi:predicted Zn-dependent protease
VPAPPSLADLGRLAERALEHAGGEAQATALWERDDAGERLSLELTCVLDGRAAGARAESLDDDGLRRTARAAALHARRPRAWPTPGLPDPVPGPPPEPRGSDPAVLRWEPVELPALPGFLVSVNTGAARTAIASTRGVRAAEERTHAIAELSAAHGGRTIRLRAAATGPAGLDLAGLAAQARALLRPQADPVDAPEGETRVVFGPDAVATILDHLRAAFGVELDLASGPLHGRSGQRVATSGVTLTDDAGHEKTLPRAYDAEGLPRRAVTLIEDGTARGRVHDTASAARGGATSTGHATRPAALAALPDHLVLTAGRAEGIAALCAPVERGLYVPALTAAREADGDAFLHATEGALLIEGGEPTRPVVDTGLRIEPLAILAGLEELGRERRTLPLSANAPHCQACAVVPGLRAQAIVRGKSRN